MVLDRIDRIRGEWMMNSLLNIVGTIDWGNFAVVAFLLAVPTVFCLLIWLKSPLVKSIGRLLATMVGLILCGWVIIAIVSFAGPTPENGFAAICGLAFGWAYAWIIGVPVLLLSFLLRVLHGVAMWFQRKLTGSEACRWSLTVCVVILLIVSLVIYPLCLCVKPSEMWKEWDGRQYRAKSVQGIVHVQIREFGRIADVCSDASGYHRFCVEPVSSDELLLKSSDVGSRIIRKVEGEWILEDVGSQYNSK